MYIAYKFRLYPDDSQKILINKTLGSSRFIYNYFLDKCKKEGYIKAYDMCKEIKELIKEYPWLKEVDSCALRSSAFNLEDAYKNYFRKRSNYPKFKNKYRDEAYKTNAIRGTYKGKEYSNIEIDVKKKIIKLPKIGKVKIRGYRNIYEFDKKIISASVIKENTGKYYVSVIVEEEMAKTKVIPRKIVGIDLGIKNQIITSDGEKYDNPKTLKKYEKRIKRLNKELSRREKKSNNYKKTKIKLARVYKKIREQRKHNLIEIINKIVEENDVIVSEKLKIEKMIEENKKLAKNLLDVTLNKITELVKWTSIKKGKYYYQVDTYYPSSQKCSVCGKKNEKIKDIKIREWTCSICLSNNDRDINASINIMMEGIKLHYQKN